MNAAYAASMGATVDRLEAEKDDITGVVITSAKKTFFAGGDLNDLQQGHARGRADEFAGLRARRARRCCAGWRRSASRSSRRSTARRSAAAWRSPGLPPPRRRRRPEGQSSASPRSSSACCPAPAASCARAHARHRRRADAAAAAGPAPAARRKAKELGLVDEVVATRDELVPAAKAWIAAQPARRRPAVGRQGLQDPRRHAVEPEARAEPAGVPGQPAQAAQGRELPGAAPHHGRGRRGRAGRLRHRARDRGPLLRRPRHRPGREEHDPGVLLRPAGGQRRPRPAGGHRAVRRRRRSSCSARA